MFSIVAALSGPKDMYKKARLESQHDVPQDNAFELEFKRKAGQELRRYILDKFVMEGMSGSDVATLSHFVTRAGGLGLRDLALDPKSASKNGHRHVKNHAGDIFPDVGVVYVDCPVHRKRDASRSVEGIPILLPSTAFQQYITHDMIYNQRKSEFQKVVGDLPSYDSHPVVVAAAKRDNLKSRVRPIALYWDGVVYTKNDSFCAFYVTDLLTQQNFCRFCSVP